MWLEICKDFFFFYYRKVTFIPYVDTRTMLILILLILMLIFRAFMDLLCMTALPCSSFCRVETCHIMQVTKESWLTSFKGKAQQSGKVEFLWQPSHSLSTDLGRLEGPVISHAAEHRNKVISSTEHFSRSNLIQKYKLV